MSATKITILVSDEPILRVRVYIAFLQVHYVGSNGFGLHQNSAVLVPRLLLSSFHPYYHLPIMLVIQEQSSSTISIQELSLGASLYQAFSLPKCLVQVIALSTRTQPTVRELSRRRIESALQRCWFHLDLLRIHVSEGPTARNFSMLSTILR